MSPNSLPHQLAQEFPGRSHPRPARFPLEYVEVDPAETIDLNAFLDQQALLLLQFAPLSSEIPPRLLITRCQGSRSLVEEEWSTRAT